MNRELLEAAIAAADGVKPGWFHVALVIELAGRLLEQLRRLNAALRGENPPVHVLALSQVSRAIGDEVSELASVMRECGFEVESTACHGVSKVVVGRATHCTPAAGKP